MTKAVMVFILLTSMYFLPPKQGKENLIVKQKEDFPLRSISLALSGSKYFIFIFFMLKS